MAIPMHSTKSGEDSSTPEVLPLPLPCVWCRRVLCVACGLVCVCVCVVVADQLPLCDGNAVQRPKARSSKKSGFGSLSRASLRTSLRKGIWGSSEEARFTRHLWL
jgi:hypothetical protein